MPDNVLFNGSIKVSFGKDRNEVIATLSEGFGEQHWLYSYLVKRVTKDAEFIVTYMTSQTERYNTIKVAEAIDEIALTLTTDTGSKKIVCYRQPPAEILIEVLEPLVKKLSKQQQEHWRQLELEDLQQMCYLIICELINKGYYVHKSLISRCFNNAVLLSLRHDKDCPQMVSIYDTYKGATGDLEKLTIGDTIVDESYELEAEEQDYRNFIDFAFSAVKDAIIKLIGPRRFDQLFRDYGYKHTTSETRRLMQKLKANLAKQGITLEDIINKYYG